MRRDKRAVSDGGLAGILAAVLFVATFTIEGWLRPGYDARSTYVSALSLGDRGWIQITSFIVTGVLMLVFARGVAAEFPKGKASRAGPLLFTIIGISLIASGPCVMDPMSTPPGEMTVHGIAHGIFGAFVFTLAPASCFVFARRFREEPKWQSFRAWTLLAGSVIVIAVVVLRITPTRPPHPPNAFNAWVGVMQRTSLVAFFAWVLAFAATLRRR